MKTYTDHDGNVWTIGEHAYPEIQHMYADLVEAVALAQAACSDRSKWANYARHLEDYFDGHTAVRPTREAYGL